MIRIAAVGDVHAAPDRRASLRRAFAALDGVDLVLVAGDLTTHGEPEQAAVMAEAVAASTSRAPVVAVLGNHDLHVDRAEELVAVLEGAGVTVLDRSSTTFDIRGTSVGVVGTKGFVGGFPDSQLPDFGEALLRRVYAETTEEVLALERGLETIRGCDVRIVLLHYSPTETTLAGEPETIWTFLGSDRLAVPIAAHPPDLVLHGHGHAGTFRGAIGDVPVYNVSQPVIRRDFWIFELDGTTAG
jgi:Icc-related predicted phosphoesterase